MVTTCAARAEGISSGLWLCTTSWSPASHSTGGHSSRFQAHTSARTGTLTSATFAAGISTASAASGRSFQELVNSVTALA